MRLERLIAAAALALAAPSALAEGPQPQLSPNEVSLEIVSRGTVRSPADKIGFILAVVGRGATAPEARRAREALETKLIAAARQTGVAAADIHAVPLSGYGFLGNEAEASELVAYLQPSAEAPHPVSDSSALEIRLRDPSSYPRLRDALEAAGAPRVPALDYQLTDPTAATRRAKAEALRLSREEAEAYAAAAGMRVVRLLRVTERVPTDFNDVAMIRDYMKQMRASPSAGTNDVETTARLEADYALAPR